MTSELPILIAIPAPDNERVVVDLFNLASKKERETAVKADTILQEDQVFFVSLLKATGAIIHYNPKRIARCNTSDSGFKVIPDQA